jgi:hypothetical protein
MATKINKSQAKKTVRRPQAKPVTRQDVETMVAEAIHMNDPLVRAHAGLVAAGTSVTSTLQSILDGMAEAVNRVWVFLGETYQTMVGYATAVIEYLGKQVNRAVGAVKDAYAYVKAYVGSMTVEWVAVHSSMVNLMVAAASIGVAIATGVAAGAGVSGLVAGVVGAGTASNVTSILVAAVTANCVAPVAYTLFKSGVPREQIAVSLADAEKQITDLLTASKRRPAAAAV